MDALVFIKIGDSDVEKKRLDIRSLLEGVEGLPEKVAVKHTKGVFHFVILLEARDEAQVSRVRAAVSEALHDSPFVTSYSVNACHEIAVSDDTSG